MRIRQVVAAILLLKQGIEKLVGSYAGFFDLEEQMGALVRECSTSLLKETLENIDDELLAGKADSLCVEGFRKRTLLSTFGELELRRRLYKDKNTGERRFLLDEALGLEPKTRVTPKFRETAVELAVEVPFRRAAEILGKTMPQVSAMSVWKATKEAGEKARSEGKELRERVFEHGEDPGGKRKAKSLNIEADGMLVGAQRSKKRHEEIKLGVAYEGKESKGDRVELLERRVVAGVIKDKGFWEETAATLGTHWDLSTVKSVVIGADGASWGKAGVEYFENATYQLDRFHLRKAMREALGHNPQDYTTVSESLKTKDLGELAKAIADAEKKAPTGKARKGIRDFEMYVIRNWSGIKGDFVSLGTIEGQVYHHLARRMKRLGARWTTEGADRMSRLCGARANNELSEYSIPGIARLPKTRKTLSTHKERVGDLDTKATEIGNWIRANMPALQGPHQSRPYVKYVLRQLLTSGGISL